MRLASRLVGALLLALIYIAFPPTVAGQSFPYGAYTTELTAKDVPSSLAGELVGVWRIEFARGASPNPNTVALIRQRDKVKYIAGTVSGSSDPTQIVTHEDGTAICGAPPQDVEYTFYPRNLDLQLRDIGDPCLARRLILTQHILRSAVLSLTIPHSEASERYDGALRQKIDSIRAATLGPNGTPLRPVLDVDVSLLEQADPGEVVAATELILQHEKKLRAEMALPGIMQGRGIDKSIVTIQSAPRSASASLIGINLDPASVLTALIGIDQILGPMLDALQANAVDQVFALKGFISTAITDLNVVFKGRINETFDNLTATEKEAVTQAQLLSYTAASSLEKLQSEGFQNAQNALCDATAMMANFPPKLIELSLIPTRPPQSDILCLYTPAVRDPGGPQETLLRFRGINLFPNGQYPTTSLMISSRPGQTSTLATAGGATTLLVALPGGLNGDIREATWKDTSIVRGDLLAQLEFAWGGSARPLRWLVQVKPYLIQRVFVRSRPRVEQPVYTLKSDGCYVNAPGGKFSGQLRYATCTLSADPDPDGNTTQAGCWEGGVTTANGDAGIDKRDFSSLTSCSWSLHAHSAGFWGAGAWYGIITVLRQRTVRRIPGPETQAELIIRQNQAVPPIEYDASALPFEAKTIDGTWQFEVRVVDNTGREYILTDQTPADPGVGAAAIDQRTGRVSVTLNPKFSQRLSK